MKSILSILFTFSLFLAIGQDEIKFKNDLNGRYVNISRTNFEIRFLEIADSTIITYSMNGVKNEFEIITIHRNIIQFQGVNGVDFIQIKGKKVLFYQRKSFSTGNSNTWNCEDYKKAKKTLKNVFQKLE